MKFKLKHLILSGFFGAAIPISALILARYAAPYSIDEEYEISALAAALSIPLSESNPSPYPVLYIQAGHYDLLVQRLRASYPDRRFSPWSERPVDHGCENKDRHFIITGVCERGDFIKTSVISYPLWNTALVVISVNNGGGQLILFRLAGKWRVISDRRIVI